MLPARLGTVPVRPREPVETGAVDSLDAAVVRRWCVAGLAALHRHQGEIDALNVFPVRDFDTGTNLALTMAAAHRAVTEDDGPPTDGAPGPVLHRMARGASAGAHGNSGVILAQVLHGLAEGVQGRPDGRGRALAAALERASWAGRRAVGEVADGTMLTVLAAAAEEAGRAGDGPDGDVLAAVATRATRAAAEALARTPGQLAKLGAAGVVDAGGRGVVVLLAALCETLAAPVAVPAVGRAEPLPDCDGPVIDGPAYEVQYELAADDPAVAVLRGELVALGESVAVAGAGPTWQVHVHSDDIGAAIEAGIRAGRPSRIRVTRFADQIAAATTAADGGGVGVVVPAGGAGLAGLVASAGAAVVPVGPGGTVRPADVCAAVEATGAGRVVVLPGWPAARDGVHAAAATSAAAGRPVTVLPTRSPVQALAALAVHDPARPFADDLVAMAEAAGACRHAELVTAASDAFTMAGRVTAGQVLGLVAGEVVLIADDGAAAAREMLDRLLSAGGELVTLVGAAGLCDALVAHLAERWPLVEVREVTGPPDGPGAALLLVGVE